MNKENVIDVVDEVTKENQLLVDIPQPMRSTDEAFDDYHSMIKELILMALPSPSKRIH